MNKTSVYTIIIISFIGLIVLLLYPKTPIQQQLNVPLVIVEPVSVQTKQITHTFSAMIVPKNSIPLLSNQPAQVVEMLVDEKAEVSVNQIIAKLLTADQQTIEIRSPIAGVISKLLVTDQQMIQANQPIAQVDSHTVDILFLVGTDIAYQELLNQSATLHIENREIDVIITDQVTIGSNPMLITLTALTQESLTPYASATLSVLNKEVTGIWIDMHLIKVDTNPYVQVVINNRLVSRKITMETFYDHQVLVKGLSVNDTLLISQTKDLKPLQKVRTQLKEQYD